MLKKKIKFVVLWGVLFSLLACDGPKESPSAGVIQVNDAVITLAEFTGQLTQEVNVDPGLDLSAESRDAFVDYLIQRELLIQEAMRLELDRQTEFIHSIQRHWQSTLIRNLLALKNKELGEQVLVTREEAQAYYAENKPQFDAPFESARSRIVRRLKREKMEAAVARWIQSLKDAARIRVDQERIRAGAG